METEKRLKMLQLFYAGVLADSIRNYSEAGILEIVESRKKMEQRLAARGQLTQLNIRTPEELFETFSGVFGCIFWNVEERPGLTKAIGTSCLLCAIAKKMDLPKPCNMYCINPVRALAEGISEENQLNVISTLWETDKCEFEVISNKTKTT